MKPGSALKVRRELSHPDAAVQEAPARFRRAPLLKWFDGIPFEARVTILCVLVILLAMGWVELIRWLTLATWWDALPRLFRRALWWALS